MENLGVTEDKKDKKIKILLDKVKELEKENGTLNDKIKELEMLPKHGEEVYLRDIVKKMTGNNVPKCPDDILEKSKEIANKCINIMKNPNNYKEKFDEKGISIPSVSLKFPVKCDKEMRSNECGNYMEGILDIARNNIISPKTSKGKLMSSAYPDRELNGEAYIEVKVFDVDSKNSSFRSFYLSTLDKITKSLPHVLVAFPHKDRVLIDTEPEVIDLYNLKLRLKQEFNASNKDIYKVVIPPNYTLEQLDLIKGQGLRVKGEKVDIKKNKYKEICNNHGLRTGGKIEEIYQRLVDYLNTNL